MLEGGDLAEVSAFLSRRMRRRIILKKEWEYRAEKMSKGERTRQRIIEKAAPLFNQKGFSGCSMQDIVEVVGLEKGSLYGHFATKEELALAAFDYAWEQTSDARCSRMDGVSDAVSKLKIHVENLVNTASFSGGCPLLNTAADSDDGNAALKRRAREALQRWESYLQGIVSEGQAKGEIRAEVDPVAVSSMLICSLEGAAALDRLNRRSTLLKKTGEQVGLFLDSIRVSS